MVPTCENRSEGQYFIIRFCFQAWKMLETKKLAERQLEVRNFCEDFNARNKEKTNENCPGVMMFYSLKTWVSQKVETFFDLGRKPVSSAYKETFQERNKDLHLICRRQTVVTIAAACLLPWNILSLQSAKLHFFLWEISWQNHRRINNLQCWIMKEKDKPRKKGF